MAALSRWADAKSGASLIEPPERAMERLGSTSKMVARGSSASSISGREPLVWLDRACIDQADEWAKIEKSLAYLPVFLAGCKSLLVLAGPTYTTRLWVRAQSCAGAADASRCIGPQLPRENPL
jgi:hypothetical protein